MKRIAIYIGIIALVACVTGQANAANLVSNGGFEAPDVTNTSPGFVTYNSTTNPAPSSLVWSVVNDGWNSAYGYYGVDHINTYWNGASGAYGDQSVDIDFETIIYQSFATVTGQTYSLSFAYANNPDQSSSTGSAGVFDAGVFADHYEANDYNFNDDEFLLNVAELTHDTSTHSNMNFTRYNGRFTAGSESTTLGFAGDAGNEYWGFVVDDVSVNAVPEPMSLSLLGMGLLGAMGAGFRRKK